MPEGPSIVLLKEEVKKFSGKKIVSVSGNSKIDQARLQDMTILSFESWGKHFLICFKGFTLRIHFLMFGSYRINEKKETPVRLSLGFKKGEINFYSCSIKFLEGDIQTHYDFTVDVMNDQWNAKAAGTRLKRAAESLICDALLEQDLFAGVGNIIKNEVLYRVRVHPESIVKAIPAPKRRKIVDEARVYSFDFLEWKRNYVLKKHWLAHTKKLCLRCDMPIIKKYTGVKKGEVFSV